jgi:hypothetical protein
MYLRRGDIIEPFPARSIRTIGQNLQQAPRLSRQQSALVPKTRAQHDAVQCCAEARTRRYRDARVSQGRPE